MTAVDSDSARRNWIIWAALLALFLGATTPTESASETSFTIGADYERRLPGIWGVGGLVDFAIGDFKRTAIVGGGSHLPSSRACTRRS